MKQPKKTNDEEGCKTEANPLVAPTPPMTETSFVRISSSSMGGRGGGSLWKHILSMFLLIERQSKSSRPLHTHESNLAAFSCFLRMSILFLHLREHFFPRNMERQNLW